MFSGCVSLTKAPDLLATSLIRSDRDAHYCYSSMFNGCSKLNYIKMLATDIPDEYCLAGWVSYVAANGTPAGFNTAVLAEIGKRLERNIELVQVDSVGRALALAQGNVDVAFWTRGASEGAVEDGLPSMSEEERNAFVQERRKNKAATEEEIAIPLIAVEL